MKLYDLTKPMHMDMEIYPGDPDFSCSPHLTLDRDGCSVSRICMGSHTGTHVDAPAHFIPGGKTISELPLADFMGQCIILEPAVQHHEIFFTDEQINAVHTAMIILCHIKDSHAVLSDQAVSVLIENAVKGIGINLLSVDHDGRSHKRLLSHDILIFENLDHMEPIVGKSGFFSGAPLCIQNCDASPIRAYCII